MNLTRYEFNGEVLSNPVIRFFLSHFFIVLLIHKLKDKKIGQLRVKHGLSEKHTKFEKMVLTNQLIHLLGRFFQIISASQNVRTLTERHSQIHLTLF